MTPAINWSGAARPATNGFQGNAIGGEGSRRASVWDESGTYCVIYVARFAEAVYVLHAFQKKTRAASPHDVEEARKGYAELIGGSYG